MKLATFSYPGPQGRESRVGVPDEQGLIDITNAAAELLRIRKGGTRARDVAAAVVPPDMIEFIATGSMALDLAAEAVEAVRTGRIGPWSSDDARVVWPADQVRLEAPLRPRSMREFGVYTEHLEHLGIKVPEAWYKLPLYFKGNPESVIGPDQTIRWPAFTTTLDFELEIGAVIGKPALNLSPDEAMDAVFGYTIFNDVSARDIQRAEQTYQVGPAKGKDFCNVLGPVIVTRDELGDGDLAVIVRVNGREWTRSTTGGMYHPWPRLVSHASWEESLVPGDLLTAGTVAGCCAAEYFLDQGRSPEDGLLAPGDVVEFEVEGIGLLRNAVGDRPDELSLDYGVPLST
ncbi:fumarylacetoacetate hydrolase family protein [Pseudonocardia eucalypti]|uniref:Fumarylacetoacetate hydrolase family protein n=1 Tax=Pseudonocardia eucalypti TaxID=648755 RepID=A0ABP9PV74_9PSEU|nr:2-keto-4-pentenoate hydratase/2-oxohepta-3-ene-1,7-dioic acid hydratase in catechol pathway [Pseudonocardia eucalypti]